MRACGQEQAGSPVRAMPLHDGGVVEVDHLDVDPTVSLVLILGFRPLLGDACRCCCAARAVVVALVLAMAFVGLGRATAASSSAALRAADGTRFLRVAGGIAGEVLP